MPAWLIIGTMVFILVFGSVVAVLWWRLTGRQPPRLAFWRPPEAPRAVVESDRDVVVVSPDAAGGAAGGTGGTHRHDGGGRD